MGDAASARPYTLCYDTTQLVALRSAIGSYVVASATWHVGLLERLERRITMHGRIVAELQRARRLDAVRPQHEWIGFSMSEIMELRALLDQVPFTDAHHAYLTRLARAIRAHFEQPAAGGGAPHQHAAAAAAAVVDPSNAEAPPEPRVIYVARAPMPRRKPARTFVRQ